MSFLDQVDIDGGPLRSGPLSLSTTATPHGFRKWLQSLDLSFRWGEGKGSSSQVEALKTSKTECYTLVWISKGS